MTTNDQRRRCTYHYKTNSITTPKTDISSTTTNRHLLPVLPTPRSLADDDSIDLLSQSVLICLRRDRGVVFRLVEGAGGAIFVCQWRHGLAFASSALRFIPDLVSRCDCVRVPNVPSSFRFSYSLVFHAVMCRLLFCIFQSLSVYLPVRLFVVLFVCPCLASISVDRVQL